MQTTFGFVHGLGKFIVTFQQAGQILRAPVTGHAFVS